MPKYIKSAFYKSSIGIIKVSTDDDKAISELCFCKNIGQNDKSLLLELCIKELSFYFKGKLKQFSTPIKTQGSEFAQKVYNELIKIPFGQTSSYKDIAKNINVPKACRAVGSANSKNEIAIIIPCHRVINSNGKLGGYNGGVHIKKALLDLEGQYVD